LTVHMGIMEQGEAVVIAKVCYPAQMRLATWVGKRMHLHCTGLGKALLSGLTDKDLEFLFQARALSRHNDSTIVSLTKLKKDLEQIRRQGYAIDDEEDEIGVRCVGVPVFDFEQHVVAAISVAGTISQITGENTPDLSQKLKRTASALSEFLTADSPSALPHHSLTLLSA
jgi:DNA-binding IclR family transcriptional regulator